MPDALRRRRQSERKSESESGSDLSEGERAALLRVPPLLRMWHRKPATQPQRAPVNTEEDVDSRDDQDVLKFFEDEDEPEEQQASAGNEHASNFVLLRPLLPDVLTTDDAQAEPELAHEESDDGGQIDEDEVNETSDRASIAPTTINEPPTTSAPALVDERSLGFIDLFIISVVPLDEDGIGSIKGAVLFAELSCVFVVFIAYLVHSIPLWPTFSRGQKGCLLIAFTAAAAFQVVVLLWYCGFLTPDVVLGLSSLMTRTISLGMVPITTTSFMGRVRMVCDEDDAPPSPRPSSSNNNVTSSRHHRQLRARSS
ncbi:hypothetical protein PINS_up008857 [Pythium insidiosum]|nr:hypothetical protein PINS_up008857 [Pythium insidiosum]